MATTAFKPPPCPPSSKVKKPPACPDCGALECLCRPRFFAGQLLSEQDLNRLDQYIKNKNRLHNLNLHGWGVVNGLKVLCDPCGQIKVTKGYAISPCGDDIVVCEDTPVDICTLINKCKQHERGPVDCTPFSAPGSDGCEDLEEEWVLAIKYAEFPSRGITALRGGGCACGKPGGRCQCQGNGGCGCQPAPGSERTKPRGAPAECEPTIVCEGYCFDVFRKPEPEDPGADDDDDLQFGGAVAEAFECCVRDLFDSIPAPPANQTTIDDIAANADQWHQWCCRTKDALIRVLTRNPGTNCETLKALHTLVCPSPGSDNFAQRIVASSFQMIHIVLEAMIDCLCLALLPPAPEGTDDPRVPLATVKVRGKECEIVRICNWTVCRKMATTWPAMCYWWSIVPIGQLLRQALDRLCCETFLLRGVERFDFAAKPQGAAVAAEEGIGGKSAFASGESFNGGARARAGHRLNPQFGLEREFSAVGRFAAAALARGDRPLDPGAVLNGVSRFNVATEDAGLERIERRNLAQFLLLNSLARPLAGAGVKHIGGVADTDMLSALLGGRDKAAPADDGELKARFSELEKQLAQQQKVIDELQQARRGKTRAKKSNKTAGKKKPVRKKTGKR